MYAYTVFGLKIHSDFRLPSLLECDGPADVVIRRQAMELPPLTKGLHSLWYRVEADTVYLRWEDIGAFRVVAGREITVSPEGDLSDLALQGFIISSGLGPLLHQRGQLVLHASAVATPHGAVAFFGHSGWGKSTLAASLHARGYPMLADDLVIIQPGETAHQVYPGLPEFRLWPDSLASIGKAEQDLPEVVPGEAKRIHRVAAEQQREPVPLHRLFLLGMGEQHAIVPMPPVTAAMALITFTYGVEVLHAVSPEQRLQKCVTIASTTAVRRLERRMSFEHLSELVDLVEDDIRHG